MKATVVVTGAGAVNAFGRGLAPLAAALRDGRPRATPVERSGGYHLAGGATLASRIESLELQPYLSPAAARRMSQPSKLAIVAARMALADAGFVAPPDGETLGVSLATAFGTAAFTERLLREIFAAGPESASPFLFAESVANAPAAQLAIAVRAQGPNLTVTQREAGPLLALAQAATQVELGRVPVMLAGDVEESSPLVHALLDRFGALARAHDGLAEAARPFDRRRDGFLLAEGATLLVLEEASAAQRRGARVQARLRMTAGAFDSTASPTDWGDGAETLAGALRRGLARAGVERESIDAVVSGASGARRGDRLEALTLRRAWEGLTLPPVLAPKAVTGEYGGGLLGSALLALAGEPFAVTPGGAELDPELAVAPHQGVLPAPRRILVTALGAGGSAAWAVLDRPDPAGL